MSRPYQLSTDALAAEDTLGDDIENEYDIDPNLLNAKYSGFKKQHEEEQRKEDILDDDNYGDDDDDDHDDDHDEDVKETDYEEREAEESEQTDLLKSILRIIFKLKSNWIKILLYFLLFLTNLGIISYISSSKGNSNIDILNIRNFGDLTKSIQNLQYQINEINNKQRLKFHDFKNYLDLKIDEFNQNFKKIDTDVSDLKRENFQILERIDKINIGGLGISNEKLPILLDEYNNIKMIPEFSQFLETKIGEIVNHDKMDETKFKLNYEKFIENHVEDIINSKVGFMNKEEILSLITLQFQENKRKLVDEIKSLTKGINNIPQKLINETPTIKNEGKINYGQAISGARIINYLTSKTFKPRYKGQNIFDSWFKPPSKYDQEQINSPFIILTTDVGYWRSSKVQGTQLSIKFLEPLYMNEFKYYHGESVLNGGGIITSCPKHMSLYVQVEGGEKLSEEEIEGHFKVAEMEYDVNKGKEQSFIISEELKRKLVKSVIVVAEDNYGNEFYTSFYKVKVWGMTKFDLYSVKKILGNKDIDQSIKKRYGTLKSFGDDDYTHLS